MITVPPPSLSLCVQMVQAEVAPSDEPGSDIERNSLSPKPEDSLGTCIYICIYYLVGVSFDCSCSLFC